MHWPRSRRLRRAEALNTELTTVLDGLWRLVRECEAVEQDFLPVITVEMALRGDYP